MTVPALCVKYPPKVPALYLELGAGSTGTSVSLRCAAGVLRRSSSATARSNAAHTHCTHARPYSFPRPWNGQLCALVLACCVRDLTRRKEVCFTRYCCSAAYTQGLAMRSRDMTNCLLQRAIFSPKYGQEAGKAPSSASRVAGKRPSLCGHSVGGQYLSHRNWLYSAECDCDAASE